MASSTSTPSILISFMDLLLFLKIEILCWRIMTPFLRSGSISLSYLATGLARRPNLHFQSHPSRAYDAPRL
ncbi:hypothetical protein B7L74_05390 [Coxiella burnetii]|nr:hypothetical protein B7L74_05390 [Coxiella burnetii]